MIVAFPISFVTSALGMVKKLSHTTWLGLGKKPDSVSFPIISILNGLFFSRLELIARQMKISFAGVIENFESTKTGRISNFS